ncbi:efflux RND transporter periplasmic adaptor subunit [Paenibacillus sepulcri]|uniref:Efflux RND transporter periplasmic adaptor subunit n=1 Tax=Paenibacillus sepulcri TaxID=359917 RepID=A0ABS7CAN6_9BACL|nr:efflux RND transporter periplasmic adaptor subunit [Paenibacillus sepulcri]
MEAAFRTGDSKSRKRKIRLLAGLFFGLLIVLTLFSNTLFALTLPKVTVEQPDTGLLNQEFKGSAAVKFVSELDLSNPSGGKVKQVLVKEGDAVQKGQALVMYENSETEQQIEAERDTLEKLKLPVQSLQRDYIEAAVNADSGAQNDARIALESARLDIAAQDRRIQALEGQLADQQKLKAPFDGIVRTVHAVEGLPSGTGEGDIRLVNSDKGLQFEMQVPVNIAATLDTAESLEVMISGKSGRSVQGNIVEIGESDASKPSESAPETIRLLVSLHDEALREGDRVELNLTAKGDENALVISSQAVHKDRDGAYVFVIDNKKGPLGNVNFARKMSVTISAANEMRTAVVDSLIGSEKVIVESSDPLADGTQVRY